MPSIDLNCDLGESFGAYTIGMDAEIFPYVTSTNIACGFHAGDPVRNAKERSAVQKVRRAGGCTPGTAGFAGLWPPQNGNFPRRSPRPT